MKVSKLAQGCHIVKHASEFTLASFAVFKFKIPVAFPVELLDPSAIFVGEFLECDRNKFLIAEQFSLQLIHIFLLNQNFVILVNPTLILVRYKDMQGLWWLVKSISPPKSISKTSLVIGFTSVCSSTNGMYRGQLWTSFALSRLGVALSSPSISCWSIEPIDSMSLNSGLWRSFGRKSYRRFSGQNCERAWLKEPESTFVEKQSNTSQKKLTGQPNVYTKIFPK